MRSTLPFLAFLTIRAAAQPVAFEVASVKPAGEPESIGKICLLPCSPGERLTVKGSRVDFRYMSLERLILTAYGLKPYQLTGPDWIKSTRFDIAAKMPASAGKERLREMLQALLAERFKLTVHRDNKELPVNALVVAKTGVKMKPSTADSSGPIPDTPGSKELYTPEGEARMLEGGGFVARGGPLGPVQEDARAAAPEKAVEPVAMRPQPA